MGTRSTIWYKNKNEQYEGIYCHWDGYLDNNGIILLNHYKDINKIKALIELGNISSLKENIYPNLDEIHSFEKPINNVVIAYTRDRGEELKKYLVTSLNGISKKAEEYNYVFENNEWYLFNNGCLESLKELINNLDKDKL